MSVYSLLFHTLFLISDSFFPLIEEVNSERQRLNLKLREKTTNKNLLQLSDLEIGLVYLVIGTKQNVVFWNKSRHWPFIASCQKRKRKSWTMH